MYKKFLFGLILGNIINYPVHAIAVSSLFEAADPETGSAEVVIENNDGKDMFVNLSMVKVEYLDGYKTVTTLNKDNFANWTFSISPSQMILADGEKRTIRMKNLCEGEKCQLEQDEVYAVDITPVPYSDGKVSSVSVAFGYRVYFMDPASKVQLDYEIERIGQTKFRFNNKSNTMLNVVVNTCNKEFSSDCIYQYKLMSGANRVFKLPKQLINKPSITMNIINANEEINHEVHI
ncbi:hypothetical protein [Vibrio crassostreae]|uniref:Gram-negative pili assembly chaperone, N-terminal domain protein n=1 Tax=Vibrio crassostreae TaxID=246167 RepID=A0ABM9QTX8_9VIBR|nr:hypothetical protein [Vibrio crassostreae]ROS63515.1 hypothetical protein EDB73_11080 [Vibrio crassostreae]RPF24041.1 hypothetical protein EDB12_0895 [Vibrio crassostreae]TCL29206.1 hypothetical protein EDB52_102494 [Vibrio crassostreae]TCT51974.1 hypothetical protein EDB39_102495 [Vibrio crassostreae]TCT60575.1 hypothetical protein EDB40_1032 [Vibrio crassostreae]